MSHRLRGMVNEEENADLDLDRWSGSSMVNEEKIADLVGADVDLIPGMEPPGPSSATKVHTGLNLGQTGRGCTMPG